MSICPDDTLHHLYADGEIPSELLNTYKQHVDSCPECQKKIMRAGALKNRLRADAAGMELSAEDLAASFERLTAKMRYKAVSREIRKNETGYAALRVLPWAAAVIITVSGVYAFWRAGSAIIDPANVIPPVLASADWPPENSLPGIAIPKDVLEDALTVLRPRFAAPAYAASYPQIIDPAADDLFYIIDNDVFRPRFVCSSAPGGRRVVHLVMLEGFWQDTQPQRGSAVPPEFRYFVRQREE